MCMGTENSSNKAKKGFVFGSFGYINICICDSLGDGK